MGEDGERHRPIMLHRVVFGSIDRFIGILIEHYAGKFPVWLSPVQVRIIPVSDKFMDYSKEILNALRAQDVRVELDDRNEKLGYKIREGRIDKVPFMIVIGEKEESGSVISVRVRDAEPDKADLGQMSIEEFISLVKRS